MEKRAKIELVVVGQNGNGMWSAFRSDDLTVEGTSEKFQYDQNTMGTRNAVMHKIADFTRALAANGYKGILSVSTIGTVAIKAYQYFKLAAKPDFDVSQLNYNSPKATEEQAKANDEANADLAGAIKFAQANGMMVAFGSTMSASHLELNIPKGVEVNAGDKLTFVNGATEDGITVRGWKNFNRTDEPVIAITQRDGSKTVGLRHPSMNRAEHKKLLNTIVSCWKECPAVAKDATKEKGSFDGLVGKTEEAA